MNFYRKTINRVKHHILDYLRKRGYHLIKTSELRNYIDYYRQVIIESRSKKTERKIDSVVFSKDRAMQLHAFLKSYMERVATRGVMKVLYKTTSERHNIAYEDLKCIFRNEDIVFIKETDFRKQLIEICRNSDASVIGLFVDDMIFLRNIDFNDILRFDPLDNIVTLGRGPDLDFSVVLQKSQKLPDFTDTGYGFMKFRWDAVKEYSDWSYPLGVGGYFFSNEELNVMLEKLEFKAPNSLENNMQYFLPFFIHRYGICGKEIVCAGIPANIVQTESYNPILGTFGIEELLILWEDGYEIERNYFYGIKGSEAQLKKYTFSKR